MAGASLDAFLPSPAQPLAAGAETEAGLWRRWHEAGEWGARQQLIGLHLEFARMLAAKLYRGRYNDEFEFAEYMQFATVGLIEAIDRYQPALTASFRSFAFARVRGAILDGITRLSEQQQQISARQRMLAERAASLASTAGEAGDDVLVQLASIALGLACSYMLEGSGLYLDSEPAAGDNSYTGIELRQLQFRLLGMVDSLPQAEREVIKYHYFQHLSFTMVAELMSLSCGRISQLHKQALEHLRLACKNTPSRDLAW
jgi:RNA polymerase sigma factor for flagellar operon FliA